MKATRVLRRYGLFFLSMALFVVCLANDGYYIDGPDPRAWASAWGLLFFGWVGVLSGTVAWLANPVIILAWLMFYSGRYRAASVMAPTSALLVLSFLLTKTVVSSETPTYSKIIGYGLGYWLWLASAVTLLIASLLESSFEGRRTSGGN